MAVLVTGGAGYIGSHCARELEKAGYEVIIADNLSKGHKSAVKGLKLYIGDIRARDFMNELFTKHEVESVIHFAADSLVGESVENPLKYYRNNIYTSLCLLEMMNVYGVKNIVFSSTAAVYGEPERTPIRETDRKEPKNPYGETKLAIEKMLSWAEAAYGIRFAALRYFNAAGADMQGDIGEDHDPETHLIPNVLQAALGIREKVHIFGDDYDTPDGTCLRDYIHVTDLADAHILALKKIISANTSIICNLGNKKGISVKQIIDTARTVTGKKISVEMSSRRKGDPAVLIASDEIAVSELGWKPKYGDIETIISTAWKWHSQNPQGYPKL
jgi:UDP-glucose 4-epimerase